MIDLTHQYALLEDGTIEELFYGFNGEPRDKYEENGKYFLDHERIVEIGQWHRAFIYCHHEILATANNKMCLEAMPEYKGEEEDAEFEKLIEKIMGGEDENRTHQCGFDKVPESASDEDLSIPQVQG